ncbi:MAG: PAS domain S-box protein [Acidobacteriia bacterium]|nr:PAS domain S-box protein [Terriglobia bacterium]
MAMPGIAGSLRAPNEISVWARIRHAERRQWWLWASAIAVTLLLTVGMASFSYVFEQSEPQISFAFRDSLRGLFGLVLLFDLYTIYQQLQIHRIRRQLTEQEEMFRLITENADDLITVIDLEGHRQYSSPGYSKIFGYSSEELLGTPIDEQIHPDDREAIHVVRRETFEKGSAPRQEYRFRQKDGEWRTLESNASPVRNHLGEIEKIVVVSRDITERKLAEQMLRQRDEQLRQAQKMEAVGRLSGGIAHDFNNLLGVIIGYSESLEHQLAQDDPLRKSAEQIRKAGERAAALTHQLLAFSRQQVLQPKILDLNAVVIDMGKMLRRLIGVDIELTTRLDSQLGRVKADQSQIEQVIVNLAVNARDAMPEGGSLVIETSNTFVNETLARGLPFLRPGPHILLTVSDTGTGMDLLTQRHIFEPFFTTKAPGKGTGLGLATVYGVVKQSGGVVGVDSNPGKGSRFKIYLPQAESSMAAPAPDPVRGEASKGNDTILLVEDEEALLNLTAGVLRENGYTVLTARDGIQALEVARTFAQSIHLLLTDVAMPRMGGPALARLLAELRPGIRVLFMTGNAGRDPSLQADLPASIEPLAKPFSHVALIGHVRQALDAAEVKV